MIARSSIETNAYLCDHDRGMCQRIQCVLVPLQDVLGAPGFGRVVTLPWAPSLAAVEEDLKAHRLQHSETPYSPCQYVWKSFANLLSLLL